MSIVPHGHSNFLAANYLYNILTICQVITVINSSPIVSAVRTNSRYGIWPIYGGMKLLATSIHLTICIDRDFFFFLVILVILVNTHLHP